MKFCTWSCDRNIAFLLRYLSMLVL